jgi:hypothetical protein
VSADLQEDHYTDTAREAEGAAPSRGDVLAARVHERWSTLLSQAGKGAGRLREAARELRRSPVLQHALAARERGNLEAAFWLLTEEFERCSDDVEVACAYWNLAVALERVDLASPAAVCLVQRYASGGDVELAAQQWAELVQLAPDVLVPPTVIATILPALRRNLEAGDPPEVEKARGLAWRAMAHALDSRNDRLTAGLALRLFELGRDVNPEAARQAAQVALESSDLHEAKRARLEAWLEGRDPDQESSAVPLHEPAKTAPSPRRSTCSPPPKQRPDVLSEAEIAVAAARLPPACRFADAPNVESRGHLEVLHADPVELSDDGLIVRLANEGPTRLEYAEIEAVSVVEVSGVASVPIALIDLVLGWSRQQQTRMRVIRLRSDGFDPAALVPNASRAGGGLAAFLGELLERSRAIPLPDPESALGLRLTAFQSLEDYEGEVLRAR